MAISNLNPLHDSDDHQAEGHENAVSLRKQVKINLKEVEELKESIRRIIDHMDLYQLQDLISQGNLGSQVEEDIELRIILK